jgi:hypothetical protein
MVFQTWIRASTLIMEAIATSVKIAREKFHKNKEEGEILKNLIKLEF